MAIDSTKTSRIGSALLLGVAVTALGYLLLARGGGDTTGADARRLVADGALLVDVRTPGEYAGGHIDGAINVPIDQIGRRLDDLGPTERPLVVYCLSGSRSARAADELREAGYTVHDLGAMSSW